MRRIVLMVAVLIVALTIGQVAAMDSTVPDRIEQGYSWTLTEADIAYYQYPGCGIYENIGIRNSTDTYKTLIHSYTDAQPYYWSMNHSNVELPSNATIDYVYIISVWTDAYPGQQAFLTTNNWTSNHTLAYEPRRTVYSMMNAVIWNVTAYRAWTVDMIHSEDTGIMVRLYISADDIYMYFEGLVFGILWHYPEQEIGYPDSEDADGSWSYTILTGNGLIGVMGIVGLCGMIATPAMAIVTFRNSDDTRIVIFVKSLVTFMFCLTMFLVSIAA